MVGRSRIVGKPLAQLLLGRHATVTCATRGRATSPPTRGARSSSRSPPAGRAVVTGDMVRPDAVVVDVGVNRLPDGKLAGDVDFATREPAGAGDHAGARAAWGR